MVKVRCVLPFLALQYVVSSFVKSSCFYRILSCCVLASIVSDMMRSCVLCSVIALSCLTVCYFRMSVLAATSMCGCFTVVRYVVFPQHAYVCVCAYFPFWLYIIGVYVMLPFNCLCVYYISLCPLPGPALPYPTLYLYYHRLLPHGVSSCHMSYPTLSYPVSSDLFTSHFKYHRHILSHLPCT